MQVDRFRNSPCGSLVPIAVEEGGRTVDHFAFVPSPLPAELMLSPLAQEAANAAAIQLGRLDAMAREMLPNPALLSRPTIRREAVSTSALEGTYAPAAEVLSSEMDDESPRSVAVIEVLNFVKATELALDRIKELPICTRLACELQDVLVRGTPSEDWQTGKVRSTQVIIGPYKGCSVLEAHYIPPPPGNDLAAGLAAWEKWIHSDPPAASNIARVAVAHYQFEALHPFTDGNGRIGRLLAILQLIEYGIIGGPLLNLSPYFEANSDRYRHLLRQVSCTGEWDDWVEFFCRALESQAKDAEDRIRDLLAWREDTLAMLKRSRVKGVALDATASLIEFPSVNVKSVAARHGVSNQAANSAVTRLCDFGVLVEVTGRSYNRTFHAPAVLDIFFRPSGPEGSGTSVS